MPNLKTPVISVILAGFSITILGNAVIRYGNVQEVEQLSRLFGYTR